MKKHTEILVTSTKTEGKSTNAFSLISYSYPPVIDPSIRRYGQEPVEKEKGTIFVQNNANISMTTSNQTCDD